MDLRMLFSIGNLTPETNYGIYRDGVLIDTQIANSTGHIRFQNSIWSSHNFTISEYVIEDIEDLTDQINALIPVLIAGMGVVIVLGVLTNGLFRPLNRSVRRIG